MSGTRVPSGIDTMSPEETRLMEEMRANDTPDDIEIPADTPPPETRQRQRTPRTARPPAADAAPVVEAPAPAEGTTEPPDSETPDLDEALGNEASPDPTLALRQERERRRAAEAARVQAETKLATDNARLQERLAIIQQAIEQASAQQTAPAAPAPVEIPDINTDPIGHFRALHEATTKRLADQEAVIQNFQQQAAQQQEAARLRSWAVSQEMEFQKTSPDYGDAMAWMKQGRHAELEAAGITDPAQREHIINGDVVAIAMRARNENANFAQRLYTIAQKRGFRGGPAPGANGTSAAPAVPPLDTEVPLAGNDAAISRAARGRAAAVTIGTAGSSAPQRLSVEQISNMSDQDFANVAAKLRAKGPNALKDLMGH